MKLHRLYVRASFALLLVTLVGCRSEPKLAEPSPTASAAAASTASADAPQRLGVGVDEALANELEQRGRSCEVPPGESRVRCPGGSNWAMIGDFLDKRRDRAASIATMAKMLGHEHEGVRGLTATVLAGAFGALWGRDREPGKVSVEAARSLRQSTFALPPPLASTALPAAVNASMLAGDGDALLAELSKPQRASLRTAAYPHLMTFGRSSTFDKIRSAALSQDEALSLAALDAPINMEAWTEAEEAAICDWADSLQADARAPRQAKLTLILGHCSGAKLDALLARAEALAKKSQVDRDFQQALVAMCNRLRRPTLRATGQQCERARGVLVETAQANQARLEDRAHAINWIARLWPDARAKQLLERLQRHPDEHLAREADDGLKWIAAANEKTPAADAQASR